MIESLLVRTLRLLSQEELETLHLVVASPLFNEVRPRETMELFEYIKPYFPDFYAQELHREVAASHFYPNHQNPDGELQRTMAQLLNIIRQFVAFKSTSISKTQTGKRKPDEKSSTEISKLLNESRQKLAMLRFYSERMHQNHTIRSAPLPAKIQDTGRKNRNPENLFHNLYRELKKNLSEINQLSDVNEYAFGDLYYFRFLLEQEKSLYDNLYNQRDSDFNILQTIEELDQYYLITKLDLMSRLLHAQRMSYLYAYDSDEIKRLNINKEVTRSMAETMFAHNYLQAPLIDLYLHLFDLLLEDKPDEAEAKFDAFVQNLEANQSLLPLTRAQDINAFLRSFWPSRYRETKNRRFLERLHQMQLQQLEQMSPGELLHASNFQNIIFTALRLDKTDWADAFFNQYHQQLIALHNCQWVIQICVSAILLRNNLPTEAADALGHYFSYGDIDDIYLYSIAATLDVRIRFTLDDLDSEESERLIHTASTRIRRDSLLPENRKKERLRFFTLAKSLYRIKVRRDLDKRADLSKDLTAWKNKLDEGPVVDWEWLEEKFAEL